MARIGLLPSTQEDPTSGAHTEAWYCRDISARMIPLLAPHQAAHWPDLDMSPAARAAVAWGATHTVSIHMDAGGGGGDPNQALYCYRNSEDFASVVHIEYCRLAGFKNRGGMYRPELAQLRIPESGGCLALLEEVCWYDRGAVMDDPAYRQKIAAALAGAVHRFFGTQPKKEVDVGIAIEKSPEGVKDWDFTGYLQTNNFVYLDVVNKDDKTISVTLDVVVSDGGRKTMSNAFSIAPHKDVGKPDFAALEVGKFMGIPNAGNFHLFVSANGKMTVKATQEKR